jgi:hypothetical protein
LQLTAAMKKINEEYFNRFMKGMNGSSPAYQARYKEMEAARNKEIHGFTRAQIFNRAAAVK